MAEFQEDAAEGAPQQASDTSWSDGSVTVAPAGYGASLSLSQ